MKYYVVIDGKETTTYTRGRINGIIYVLSGMPAMSYGYYQEGTEDHVNFVTAFEGDEEMLRKIVNVIDDIYPGVIVETRN